MGAWFYMTAVGNFVAGKIGEATGGHGGEMSKEKLLEIYEMFGWISIGAAVAVLLLSPIVKRWMHLDTLQDRDPLAGRDELAEPLRRACSRARDQASPQRVAVERGMMKLKGGGSVLAVALLSACAQLAPPPKKAAPVRINQDPYPSTYHRYPGALTVIRGATVFDGEGGRIDNGTVVLADGIIQAVGGPEMPVPSGAYEIDGTGKFVTPGHHRRPQPPWRLSVARHPVASDGNEATGPVRPEVWAEHSVWPQDPGFSRALMNGGVTALQILPGSANLFGGRSVTLKNVPARTVQGMKFPGAPYGLKMACGENPKRVYGSKGQMPQTRMGNIAVTRATWIKAQAYKRKWDKYDKNGGDMPERDLAMDTLVGVLGGEDPRSQPLLPRRRDGRHDRCGQGVRLQDRHRSTTRSRPTRSPTCWPPTASARRCGPTGGASRWKPTTGSRRTSRWSTRPAPAPSSIRTTPTASSASTRKPPRRSADARRMGLNISDEHAWTWLSSIRPRRSGSPTRPAASRSARWPTSCSGTPIRSAPMRGPTRVWIDGALMYFSGNPRLRPVSDFELGQPGEGRREVIRAR